MTASWHIKITERPLSESDPRPHYLVKIRSVANESEPYSYGGPTEKATLDDAYAHIRSTLKGFDSLKDTIHLGLQKFSDVESAMTAIQADPFAEDLGPNE